MFRSRHVLLGYECQLAVVVRYRHGRAGTRVRYEQTRCYGTAAASLHPKGVPIKLLALFVVKAVCFLALGCRPTPWFCEPLRRNQARPNHRHQRSVDSRINKPSRIRPSSLESVRKMALSNKSDRFQMHPPARPHFCRGYGRD